MALTTTVTDMIPFIRGLIKDFENPNGRDPFEYNGDEVFTLSENFVKDASIKVFVNGVELSSDDFSYDADKNQVVVDIVDSGSGLLIGDIVVITYKFYKRYSDEEISLYMGSALSYFVQHRYKKAFQIENGEVTTVEGEAPTFNELSFICVITSILIDPQNLQINTPEFKLVPQRNESDQKQIEKAFQQFNRFIGDVSFNPLWMGGYENYC